VLREFATNVQRFFVTSLFKHVATVWRPRDFIAERVFIFRLVGDKYWQPKAIQTPWPLVRKWTIPTERPPLIVEVSPSFFG
jgi:hypothetical protein